jgi:hypothetical protein
MRKINASSFGDLLEMEPIARRHRFVKGNCSNGLLAFGYLLDHHGRGDQGYKKSTQQNP